MYIHTKKRATAFKAIALSLCLCAGSIAYAIPTQADDVKSLQDQYNKLQQQQQQLQQTLNQQNTQLSSESKKKATLDSNIKVIQEQIAVLNDQVSTLNTQMDETTKQVADTQKSVTDDENLLKQRICTLYEVGDVSYLQVIFSSKNLTDFLSRIDVLKCISKHDSDMVNSLKANVAKLKDEQTSLQTTKNSLMGSQGTLAAKKDVLAAQQAQQNQVVQQLQSNVNSTQQQKATVVQQSAKTDAQINAEMAKRAAAATQTYVPRPTPSIPSIPSGSRGSNPSGPAIVACAEGYRGVPYVTDGDSASGFDCSGFTAFVYSTYHVYLPHSAAGQADYIQKVPEGSLQPGDLVFFHTDRPGISHVGIYTGGGNFIAANNDGVSEHPMSWLRGTYICGGPVVRSN